jgi:hypothetical protein
VPVHLPVFGAVTVEGRALDVLWPELTPEQLLALLYTEPRRLDLPEDERAALGRPASPVAWTAADVPLLDELAELLGDTGAVERAAGPVPGSRPSAPRRSGMRRRSWTISARPAPSPCPRTRPGVRGLGRRPAHRGGPARFRDLFGSIGYSS